MTAGDHQPALRATSILWESRDKSSILLDIPRSIEEAQVGPGATLTRRILSSEAISKPFALPEPKNGSLVGSKSQAALLADLMTGAQVTRSLDLMNEEYEGPMCLPRVIEALSNEEEDNVEQTHILPNAHYISGSIEETKQQLSDAGVPFDIIVLDIIPPWPSRSVKRKTDKYVTVRDLTAMRTLLAQVPVQEHLDADGIIAVWITNREAIHHSLTSPGGIFAHWGLVAIGEWTWLKITSQGEPMFSVDSSWRQPWERLLLARRPGASKLPQLAGLKTIMAVPDVHSRKPNLRGLFGHLLLADTPKRPIGLEVFARNLTAGWWSWGNQVLEFQKTKYWVAEKPDTEDAATAAVEAQIAAD